MSKTTNSKQQTKQINQNSEISLEQKLAKLQASLDWFYSEDFKLDHALDRYRSTIDLANSLRTDLINLKNQIELISQDFTKE